MKRTTGLLFCGALLVLQAQLKVVAGDDAPEPMNDPTRTCFVREKFLWMLEDNATKLKRFSGIAKCMSVKLSKIESMKVEEHEGKFAQDVDDDKEELECYKTEAMHIALSDCVLYLCKKNGDC